MIDRTISSPSPMLRAPNEEATRLMAPVGVAREDDLVHRGRVEEASRRLARVLEALRGGI